MEDDREAALAALRVVYLEERAADNLEVVLFEDLSKGELDAKQRETLMRLVRQIDKVSEHMKQAGLSLELLMESKKKVPRQFWKYYKDITDLLIDQTKDLRSAVEAFGRDENEVLDYREKVKTLEQKIDDHYFKLRKTLIGSAAQPLALVVLTDLLVSIESASDRAEEAADMLFILVMANR